MVYIAIIEGFHAVSGVDPPSPLFCAGKYPPEMKYTECP